MPRLDGKAAIVTEAGQGIGRGVARAFAREGAAVTIADSAYVTGNTVFADGGSHINGVQWVPPLP